VLIEQVHLAYDGSILFDDLNLTLRAGKWTCLLGASGVGKSTLLKLISGLAPSNSKREQFRGSITVDDKQPLLGQIAYMAQTDLLLPWFSALDNALLGAKLRGSISKTL